MMKFRLSILCITFLFLFDSFNAHAAESLSRDDEIRASLVLYLLKKIDEPLMICLSNHDMLLETDVPADYVDPSIALISHLRKYSNRIWPESYCTITKHGPVLRTGEAANIIYLRKNIICGKIMCTARFDLYSGAIGSYGETAFLLRKGNRYKVMDTHLDWIS